ncbi:MAG: thiamine pyrophosphate-dependent enzyme [Candidatus Kapabacteria bacterium]|nr:thiamine pyrophosphate-dependent enzyme [Candidatus Kapabacteria bacterium]
MSKTNKSEKRTKILITEQSLLHTIESSIDSSSCAQSRGPACAVETVPLIKSGNPHEELNLSKEDMIIALKNMLRARRSDEKHLILLKQGKSHFHIGGSGHEAIQTAIGYTMKAGYDWGWSYYRDLALVYALGYTIRDYFLLAMGKPEDPGAGGRQMPNHYGHPALRLPTLSTSTGTQFLNAVGSALASRRNETDEIVYVASGEGTTSEGEFYEAVNWASREKLPVMFCIQDNGFAISVPREKQSMGSDVGHSFCCYSNLKMITFDGTDYFESISAARRAIDYMRAGRGPTLLHAKVERLLPHSSSDDQRKYRTAEDIDSGKKNRDCIIKLKAYLLDKSICTIDELNHITDEVSREVDDAADWALSRPDANPEESTNHIFAPAETRMLNYTHSEPQGKNSAVMVDAINHALREEMKFNDKMMIFGQDVEDPKGGVFTATKGLSNDYGTKRVFNSPLAEASIIGVALGLAVGGYKPVVEIQFGDYIWPAFQQLRNELATMRYRSNGGFKAPVVVRVPVGGYIHGGLCHSQNIEGFFAHIPGLFIAYPSTAADAKGLLKTACRIEDPVIFCEHKGMYRLPFSTTIEPDENYLIPFGKGKIVRSGTDATVVTYGMCVRDSLNAAKKLEAELGASIEIIDLRTICPWDKELVLDSVKKTGRVLVAHEDTITSGFGAEIAATIAHQAFSFLDAPVMRHAAKDSFIPFAPNYEADVLPSEAKILKDLKGLLSY